MYNKCIDKFQKSNKKTDTFAAENNRFTEHPSVVYNFNRTVYITKTNNTDATNVAAEHSISSGQHLS